LTATPCRRTVLNEKKQYGPPSGQFQGWIVKNPLNSLLIVEPLAAPRGTILYARAGRHAGHIGGWLFPAGDKNFTNLIKKMQ